MSQAVVCRSIDGFERYEKLPNAELTSDEKLLLYFRPSGYKTAVVDKVTQAHFTEDVQIRRREDKVVVRQQIKLMEYKPKIPDPPQILYLRNSISLKGLPPGEYEFVVILHDQVAKTPPAKQVVRFKVVAAKKEPRKSEPSPTKSDDAAAEERLPADDPPLGNGAEPKGRS